MKQLSVFYRRPPVRRGSANNTWKGGMPTWVCGLCGTTFSAYRKLGGEPRRFCSWQCSNTAHNRTAVDMRSRLKFENILLEEMEAEGWLGTRSPGSRGPFDLLVMNEDEVRIIQVKTTKRPTHPGTVAMIADAVAEIKTVPVPTACSRWIYLKVMYGPWIQMCVDCWPNERELVRDEIRTAIGAVL